MTAAHKLFVRISTAADIDRIAGFYQDNPSPFVFPREHAVWKERAAAGAVTIIEDEQGGIIASSISYPIAVRNEKGDVLHKWTEIGSTLIALRDTGLFKTLLSAQVLAASLLEPPAQGFVLEIVAANHRSIQVFEKAGSAPFTVPPELFSAVQQTFTAESQNRDVRWFHIAPEKAQEMAQALLETEQNPRLANRKTGEEYILDFSRYQPLLKFRAEIRQWAGLSPATPATAAPRLKNPGQT